MAVREGRILPGQSVFHPPVYYYSDKLPKAQLDLMIREASRSRHNCLHALETAPSMEMIATALEMRKTNQPEEPMFRTLLRIRAAWREAGKI
jgi:hypothetical protein